MTESERIGLHITNKGDAYEAKKKELDKLKVRLRAGEMVRGGPFAVDESIMNNLRNQISALENEVDGLRNELFRVDWN